MAELKEGQTRVYITGLLDDGIIESGTWDDTSGHHGISYGDSKDFSQPQGYAGIKGLDWHLSRDDAVLVMEVKCIRQMGAIRKEFIDNETEISVKLKKLELMRF